ncbi:MAG: hypothetical protein KGO96_02415 [Elusimicrobia bacterium]|nr:hypothetical protein [Elusimicrobiota bacterium]MDE2236888.1 hypothetical protein [Elusimicrobiota bacterium]MDE2424748.1 hypothetical protein [Elusimicrobiota bacterium]
MKKSTRRTFYGLAALLLSLPPLAAAHETTQADLLALIQQDFRQVHKELKWMNPAKSAKGLPQGYYASQRGPNFKTVVGTKDDFVARRSVFEIECSGLSSGCGDWAGVFARRLSAHVRKENIMFVDSAMLAAFSLIDHSAGHAVVAVRLGSSGRWILADPTAKKILSTNWNPAAKTFKSFGFTFWIGYRGSFEDAPQRNGREDLGAFYARTLEDAAKNGKRTLDNAIPRLELVVDDRDAGLRQFKSKVEGYYEQIRREYGVVPERSVRVRLERMSPSFVKPLSYFRDGEGDIYVAAHGPNGPDLRVLLPPHSDLGLEKFASIEMGVLSYHPRKAVRRR